MQIDVRWKGTERSVALSKFVTMVLRTALARCSHQIRRVVVRLEDENGPKGGVDKKCMVQASSKSGEWCVEIKDQDFYAAAHRAVSLLKRSIMRQSSMRQSSKRARHQSLATLPLAE